MALRDVISRLKEQKERREMRGRYILGTLSAIDYDDSCKVAGRPNYMWVREYNNPNNAFQAFAPATQDRPGLPVYVTKNVQPPHYRVQVVDIDYSRMDDNEDVSNSYQAHALAHEWPDGAPGADVVTVYPRAIYPLCTRRYSGLVVYVTPGIYMYNDTAVKFTGVLYDLAAHLPAAGNALRVCLYIDPGTNTVSALESSEVTANIDPEYPLPTVGNLPVGWVKLLSTTTTVVESQITDPRAFVSVSDYDPDNYYTKNELTVSGAGGQVHWDNVTNKPPMEVTLFLHEEDADVAGYEQLLEHPSDDPENIDSAVLAEVDTEYVIDEYITYPPTGWGRTFIQGGTWQFMTWVRVDSSVGDTRLVIRVYKRDQAGTESELFNVTSDEINNTAVEEVDIETVQPDIFLDETDRLVVKYLGKSTSVADRTIYLYYEGSVNYSHIHLPGAGISGGGGAVDFVDLADVPNSYAGAGGYAVKVNATADGLEFVDETIPEAFTDLSDTPSDYTDQAGKVVKVNATEDGLEFGDVGWDDVADKPETFNRFYPKEGDLSLYKNFYGSTTNVALPDADDEVFIKSFSILNLGLTKIPAGTWTIQTVVSGATTVSGALSLIAKVYHLDEAGDPTLLFSVEEVLPGTTPSYETVVFTDVQDALDLTPYEGLRVTFYGKSAQGGTDSITLRPYPQVSSGVETYLEIPPVVSINTGISSLSDLNDVFIDGITDGQSLIFDSTPGQWVPYDPAGGVTVEETDGAPSIAADKIVFGPGTVSDLGSGDARVKGLYVPTGGEFLTDSAGNSWQQGAKNTGTYTFRPQDNNNAWPSNAIALHLFVFSIWAAANNTYILNIRTTSGGANLAQVRALVAGVGYSINTNIALDGNGYFYVNVAGNASQSSTIRVLGYYV